jgi:hypothetical protein
MFRDKKHTKYYLISIVYFAILATTFVVGIHRNPNFNIYDFCMGLSTELTGLIIAFIVVDYYVKTKTERLQERKQNKTPDLSKKNFEIINGEGLTSVKSISTLRDTRTGVQYLLVIHEDGSGLTPLLDKEGKPIIDEHAE